MDDRKTAANHGTKAADPEVTLAQLLTGTPRPMQWPRFSLKQFLVSVVVVSIGIALLTSSTMAGNPTIDVVSFSCVVVGSAVVIAGISHLFFPQELVIAFACIGAVTTMVLLNAFHKEVSHDFEGLTLLLLSFPCGFVWIVGSGLALCQKRFAALCVALIPFSVLLIIIVFGLLVASHKCEVRLHPDEYRIGVNPISKNLS